MASEGGAALPGSPGKLWGLRRLADRRGCFKMLALDQRPPMKALVRDKRGTEAADPADLRALRQSLARHLAPEASAVLLDPHGAYPAASHLVDPHSGLLVTLEDSNVEHTDTGRKSHLIQDWSVAKTKRLGADAVKALAWFRPDAPADVVDHQKAFVKALGDACRQYDIPFVFELLLYPLPGETGQGAGYVEQPDKRADLVLESVRTFADPAYGVDLFKLESPLPAKEVPDPAEESSAVADTQGWFDRLNQASGRPWAMLSAGAGMEPFRRVVAYACRAGASGYLAGRAIWWQAAQAFPDRQRFEGGLARDGVPYMRALNALVDASARPWTAWPPYDGGLALTGYGERFRESYGDFQEET